MKNLRIICCLLFVLVCVFGLKAQQDYYRRHYVIVVDQGVIQGHPNTSHLYSDIKELFVDNKPLTEKYDQESLPNFKEDCDQISVFASGFPHNSWPRLGDKQMLTQQKNGYISYI